MFQKKRYYSISFFLKNLGLIALIVFSLNISPHSYAFSGNIYKSYSTIVPFYSSTDPIVFQTLSSNGEKLLVCLRGNRSKKILIYVANANGTRLEEVFSAGHYTVDQEKTYFTPLDIPPIISGNGNIIAVGVRAVLDINRRNDFIMIYDTQTQRRVFFQLRLLIPGTNYVKLPENGFLYPIFSLDYNGAQIVAQIETGVDSPSCKSYDTALLLSNINGSNQRILVGPEDFSRPNCSFRWKDYPRSPHQPQLNYNGDKVVFYGQVFGTRDPYDHNGELFVINTNKTNLRQITFLRREDTKIEALGPYCLNYYGSRIFFKHLIQQHYYISSIAIDGGIIQNHVRVDKDTSFSISGDGRKIFFIDQNHNNSLVYFDISKEILFLVVDRSWSGVPYRYGLLDQMIPDAIQASSVTSFLGNQLILTISNNQNSWLYKIDIDPQIMTPQTIKMSFEMNKPVFSVNDRRITLPVPPYIRNGRSMIPLLSFAEYFGYKLNSSPNSPQYFLRANGNILLINIGSPKGLWNNKEVSFPLAIEVKNREVFFPASIVRDYLGLKLAWDSQSQILQILRIHD